jgi:hypothetical protein
MPSYVSSAVQQPQPVCSGSHLDLARKDDNLTAHASSVMPGPNTEPEMQNRQDFSESLAESRL